MASRQSRVGIGLPVYNGERYLEECLNSLLAQTFEDFELIISDNASTDRTEEICRRYAARDKRIRYVRNEVNIGVYGNFNRVFQLCSGEYFKWASVDDVCHRDLIARCLDVLDTNPTAVVAYPKTSFIDERGTLLDINDRGWNLMSSDPVERMRYVIYAGHAINAFYGLTRGWNLAKTHLFPLYNSGDYRLLGELSLMGKFVEVPGQLFYRRIHRNASSQNQDREWQHKFFKTSRGQTLLPLWYLCFDHSLTVIQSNVRIDEKLSLIASVMNRMFLSKRQLMEELRLASRFYLARIR